MPALRMLPGEREEAHLRPTPWSYLPSYTRGLAFAAFGGLLAVLFRTSWWQDANGGPWWAFWTYLYGNAVMGYVLLALGLVGGGMLYALSLRRPWWLGGVGGALVAAAVTAATVAWFAGDYDVFVPLLLAAASLVAIVTLEADRWLRAIRFTNIRVVAHGGIWDRKERQVRYEDIADIDRHQGPLGRIFDYGTLVPVLSPHAREDEGVTIPGIRPLRQGHELLAAMVQHATASPELKKADDTESRLYRALGHFRRDGAAGP